MTRIFKKISGFTAGIMAVLFGLNMLYVPVSFAQVSIIMPPAGQMVHITRHFDPPQMVGLKVNLKDPFNFDFIMDQGESPMSDLDKKEEFNKIIKYFLVSLAMPNKDMWVNLSPYESSRIVPEVFGQTEMGRDLLAQDYILKQFTASLMYPEDGLGKKFWSEVYAQAQARFGTTDISVNTFNKVWIVADKADVYQKGDTAFLVDSHLKVMLEQDYMAIEKNREQFGNVQTVKEDSKDTRSQMASAIVREIIIPAIEKEVNEGKSFAAVRQVYSAEILATWFKKTLRQSLLGQVFADKAKIAGQKNSDPQAMEKIYDQYLSAYKKGVFNFIKEDETPDGQMIPRKYFSGGMIGVPENLIDTDPSKAMVVDFAMGALKKVLFVATVTLVTTAGLAFSAGSAQAHSRNYHPAAHKAVTHVVNHARVGTIDPVGDFFRSIVSAIEGPHSTAGYQKPYHHTYAARTTYTARAHHAVATPTVPFFDIIFANHSAASTPQAVRYHNQNLHRVRHVTSTVVRAHPAVNVVPLPKPAPLLKTGEVSAGASATTHTVARVTAQAASRMFTPILNYTPIPQQVLISQRPQQEALPLQAAGASPSPPPPPRKLSVMSTTVIPAASIWPSVSAPLTLPNTLSVFSSITFPPQPSPVLTLNDIYSHVAQGTADAVAGSQRWFNKNVTDIISSFKEYSLFTQDGIKELMRSLRQYEAFRANPYPDPGNGQPDIGYGNTLPEFLRVARQIWPQEYVKGRPVRVTQGQADQVLAYLLPKYIQQATIDVGGEEAFKKLSEGYKEVLVQMVAYQMDPRSLNNPQIQRIIEDIKNGNIGEVRGSGAAHEIATSFFVKYDRERIAYYILRLQYPNALPADFQKRLQITVAEINQIMPREPRRLAMRQAPQSAASFFGRLFGQPTPSPQSKHRVFSKERRHLRVARNDHAMKAAEYGGISLSDEHLTMNIKVDGKGLPLPARFQDKAMINLNGLRSIILRITPVTPQNVPALYELVK